MVPHKLESSTEQPVARSAVPISTPWHSETDEAQEGDTPWLMSYLDFMAVLVTLFVFLYASEKAHNLLEPAVAAVEEATAASPVAEETEMAEQMPASEDQQEDSQEDEASETASEQTPATAEATSQAATVVASEAHQAIAEPAASPVNSAPTAAPVAAPINPAALPQPVVTDAAKRDSVTEPPPAGGDANLPQTALSKLADRVAVKQDAQAMAIEINDTILFDAASVELTGNGRALLNELKPVLIEHPGLITVEGHTDDRPISSTHFPSNWELSTARASTVTRYLIALGIAAERISPLGRADTQPRTSNATSEGRAQNRRVGIVLHAPLH